MNSKTGITVVYARKPYPRDARPSIFLMGPTPRSNDVQSWRPHAVDLLHAKGFRGSVYVPEDTPDPDGISRFRGNYDDQVEWEQEGLALATVIIAYVPRELTTMPAFTTNVEWGMYWDSGKIVLGSPAEAPGNKYLEWGARQAGVPTSRSLEETVDDALTLITSRQTSSEDCVFCDIATFDPHTQVERRWPQAVLITPLNPVTPGHKLVIPSVHVAHAGVAPAVTAETMRAASEYAETLGQDFNLITSRGESATQTVPHLHIHVVPRHEGDGLKLPWSD
ncbi:MAG: HIT domain-containing protein [Candidatus Saccharimonas sp.]